MRATAIGLVLAAHSIPHFFPGALARIPGGLPVHEGFAMMGYVGVVLFFALSGYLVGGQLLADAATGAPDWLARFWLRRWMRTLPAYYVFLAANAWLWTVTAGGAGPIASYVVFQQNFVHDFTGIFHESWSLGVEELFYLGAPLVVLGSFLVERRWRVPLAACLLIAVSWTARAIGAARGVPSLDLRYAVLYQLDAIGLGVAVAWAATYYPNLLRRRRQSLLAASVALLAAALVLGAYAARAAAPDAWLAVVYTVAGLGAALCLPAAQHAAAPAGSTVRNLSRLAYGLYLSHILVMTSMDLLWDRPGSGLRGAALMVVWAAVTWVMAELCFRLFEAPFMRWRPAAARRPSQANNPAGPSADPIP